MPKDRDHKHRISFVSEKSFLRNAPLKSTNLKSIASEFEDGTTMRCIVIQDSWTNQAIEGGFPWNTFMHKDLENNGYPLDNIQPLRCQEILGDAS